MAKKNGGRWVSGCKERGEWAELCFMARVKGMGLGVLKPYGDSRLYDVAVEDGGPILRVQVKSTIYCRRGREYSLNVMGPKRKRYAKGSVDFFAVYLIPIEEWYIIPYAAMGKKLTFHHTPGSKRGKWTEYREAWELLRGGREGALTIRACVEGGDAGGRATGAEAQPVWVRLTRRLKRRSSTVLHTFQMGRDVHDSGWGG